MGRVFVALETRLGREVVIKVLSPDMAASVNVERFEREIQLAARLQHPHIVPLLTTGGSGSLLYYVMPFISGESLRVRLAREGELPIPEVVKILLEVTDALSYAHRNGVVHRDIKPDNVLLAEGHALVTDFGVAKAVSASSGSATLTSLGVALGTPAYMAPEQAAADPNMDHRADIYSLGVLAYEMLTGRTPFTAPTPQALLAAHITLAPDPVPRHRPAVPGPLSALVMRCLEKHAADRWQSAAEIVSQLEAMSTPSGGIVPTGTTPVISSGTKDAIRRGHPARVAALFSAAAAAVLGVVYLLVHFLGLPDWVFFGTVMLLILGFPIMILTGYLERRRAQARVTGRTTTTPPGLHRLFTWRRAIQGGLLAFGLLGLGTVSWTLMRRLGIGPVGTLMAKGRLAEKDRIVVADFENRTTDATLGQSLTEAFRIDLSQTRIVTLVSSAAVTEALGHMQRSPAAPLTADLAREVATREGAKAVVAGEVSAVGEEYVLSARLFAASDGSELVALRETAANDRELVAALDRLSKALRERMGESLRTIRAGEPLERVTTSSIAALKLYSDGVRAFNQGDYTSAAAAFDRALALDSNFAMAWRKLGVAQDHLGANRDQTVAALRHAYLLRDHLPESERLHTAAYYAWTVSNDHAAAVAAYRQLLAIDPDDDIALSNLGEILARHGSYAEAESLIAKSNQIAPFSFGFSVEMFLRIAQGKGDLARQSLAQAATRFPDSYDFQWARAWLPATTGVYDSAERAFISMGLRYREPATQADVHLNLAVLNEIQGKLAAAAHQLRLYAGVEEQRTDYGSALDAGAMLAVAAAFFQHDSAGSIRVLDSVLTRHPLEQIGPFARPYVGLGVAYAAAGQPAQARRLFAEYRATRPEEVRNRWEPYLEGYVALAEHRPQEEIAAFRQVVEQRAVCNTCGFWELALAFDQAGQRDSALVAYERVVTEPWLMNELSNYQEWKTGVTFAPSLRRLGELYDARGDREKAVEYYGRFVDLWKEADPALQPAVREVKARLSQLAGERH